MDLTKFKEYESLCKSKGGFLVTKYSVDLRSNSKFKFKCKEGHVWETTIYSIKQGTWCSECRRKETFNRLREERIKIILRDIKKIVLQRGGELLKYDYKNQQSKFKFKCRDVTLPPIPYCYIH